jgi:hypothetical protein
VADGSLHSGEDAPAIRDFLGVRRMPPPAVLPFDDLFVRFAGDHEQERDDAEVPGVVVRTRMNNVDPMAEFAFAPMSSLPSRRG